VRRSVAVCCGSAWDALTQLLVWPPNLYRFAFSGNVYLTAASLFFVLGSALYVCALGLDLQEMAQAKEKVGGAHQTPRRRKPPLCT